MAESLIWRPDAVLRTIFSSHSRGSEQCIAPVFAALCRLGLSHELCGEFLWLILIRKRGRLVFARKSANRLLHSRDFCQLNVDCFQFVNMPCLGRYSALHQCLLGASRVSRCKGPHLS